MYNFFFQCLPDTWYSAVDMQMFLLSPMVVFPLWRWPRKIGPIILFLLMLSASLFYIMIINLKWDIPLVSTITRAYLTCIIIYLFNLLIVTITFLITFSQIHEKTVINILSVLLLSDIKSSPSLPGWNHAWLDFTSDQEYNNFD